MISNLDTFLSDLDASKELPLRIHKAATIKVLAETLDFIDRRSPVRTGSYRASHEIKAAGQVLYQHPSKPGADAKVAYHGRVLFGPNRVGDAIRALRRSLPAGASASIENDRFYAAIIENGDAKRPPRRIYGLASDLASVLVDDIARKAAGLSQLELLAELQSV